MKTSLIGKRVVITGGSSGIGKATAQLLLQEGARVVLLARTPHRLKGAVEELRPLGDVTGIVTDVGNTQSVNDSFVEAEEFLGGIDILINNASLPANGILNTPTEDWQNVLNTNVLGYMACAREAVERMRLQNSGHIVNVGSLGVKVLDNGADLYIATKTAVAGFTESLRKRLTEENIRVTLINPGATASNMVTETEEEQLEMKRQGDMLDPMRVAEAILFCVDRSPLVDITELVIRPHRQSRL